MASTKKPRLDSKESDLAFGADLRGAQVEEKEMNTAQTREGMLGP